MGFRPRYRWSMVLPGAVAHLHRRLRVKAAALRDLTRPGYHFGCKRVLLANDYYPAIVRPNVDIV
ncbi:cyclohexanone monooxygenase, partial [Actinomadura kijaniata]